MLQRDLKAAGVPYKTEAGYADFHALRHTYISRLIRSGVNLKVAQALARHSSVVLTADLYGHLAPGEKTAAVAGFTLPGCMQDACAGGGDDEPPGNVGESAGSQRSFNPLVVGSIPTRLTGRKP